MPEIIRYKREGLCDEVRELIVVMLWDSEETEEIVFEFLKGLLNALVPVNRLTYLKFEHVKICESYSYSLFQVGPSGFCQLNSQYQIIPMNKLIVY